MNYAMPTIPAELFHKISLCFAVSPSYAQTKEVNVNVWQYPFGILEAVYLAMFNFYNGEVSKKTDYVVR